ncbi:MAG: sugar ABC transporter permease [Candidatus Zixiibacteriota bacterium]
MVDGKAAEVSKNEHILPKKPGHRWFLLSGPICIILLVTIGLPVCYTIFSSFWEKRGYSATVHFIGFANYASVLTDEAFWSSITTGFLYAVISSILQLVIGLWGALFVIRRGRYRNLLSSIIFLPYLLPSVVLVILWTFALNDSVGYVNYVLRAMDILPPQWFGEATIFWTLVILSVWQFFPFVFFAIYGRLTLISSELLESAELEGATHIQRTWHIVMPELKSLILSIVVLRFIIMFMKFDIPWLLASSRGGGRDLLTPAVYAYRVAFERLNIGMAFAITTIFLLILAIVMIIVIRISRSTNAEAA